MDDLNRHLDLLDNEIHVARQLLAAIADEKTALSDRDPAQLQHASAIKQGLVDELQQATHSRLHHIDTSSAKADIDSNEQVKSRRESLTDVAMECFESNRLVGQLINRRAQMLSQSMQTLRATAPQSELTYESSGNISQTGGQNPSPFRRV